MVAVAHQNGTLEDAKQVDPNMVCLGAVFGVLGVRGALRVKVFTEEGDSLSDYGPVMVLRANETVGKRYQLKILHNIKGGVVVKLKDVDDRNLAETFKGARFYIDRAALPEIEEDGEYYFDDLIGLIVKDPNGKVFAVVTGVFNFGAGDIIEVAVKQDNEKVMFPFSNLIVPEVNIDAGYIVINRSAFNDDEEADNKMETE